MIDLKELEKADSILKRGLTVALHIIDPAALLPPNSTLWKSSKVNIRKPSYNLDSRHGFSFETKPSSQISYRPSPPSSTSNVVLPTSSNGVLLASMTRGNSTPFDIPSNRPRPPPYIPSSSFIHPDTLLNPNYQAAPVMTAEKEQEALKNFFEAALEPEKDEDSTKETEDDDNAGKVDGLYVTLMKHQISGLEFLCAHESTLDKKGNGRYGGILADDVPPQSPDSC
jgi:SNF2 family DNA or RNA helicase